MHTGSSAPLAAPAALALAPAGDAVYVADVVTGALVRLPLPSTSSSPGFSPSEVAIAVVAPPSAAPPPLPPPGNAWRSLDEASLREPRALAVVDKELAGGRVWLLVAEAAAVVLVDVAARKVTTVAGSGHPGFADSTSHQLAGALHRPESIVALDGANYVLADTYNHALRSLHLEADASAPTGFRGVLTTLAGTGAAGHVDGSADEALFNFPLKLAYDPATAAVYVSELNDVVRSLSIFTAAVTTLASPPLAFPSALVFNPLTGSLLVADSDSAVLVELPITASTGTSSAMPMAAPDAAASPSLDALLPSPSSPARDAERVSRLRDALRECGLAAGMETRGIEALLEENVKLREQNAKLMAALSELSASHDALRALVRASLAS
ncbi:uncharacterized protein AMSG_08235 [Thecamonas trahens ATCC 50062]|uniref:NHL repeat containing protein n=1 Tax=Thecamonas trahens ATCC 50062 TaxID=461836 RepID=A0A0L0DIB8_THETB|nr:hypothetical protein AMSG_08235 [Thecamonas trahens ATCC 50062]KNC51985.1 hypothetical protein AMSG_08235 [Thecamonas trahens ATCC 50062]|eukprot:XP_013755571.1 hypothetical protein AMSG_08235 [Thecamonas trahens ATCC 50062]